MDLSDLTTQGAPAGADLGEIEGRLIQLTREGSGGTRPLDEVIAELHALARRLRPIYLAVQESLGRRDLTYDDVVSLEDVKRRALWLYRRSRLEQLFYAKLKLERSLRDTLYRQILEAYDEFSSMEEMEGRLRGLAEDLLAAELVQEDGQDAG